MSYRVPERSSTSPEGKYYRYFPSVEPIAAMRTKFAKRIAKVNEVELNMEHTLKILVTHPSTELYGADRMMVVTADMLSKAGHRVTVLLPSRGPICQELGDRDLEWRVAGVPVLRKALLSFRGILRLLRNLPRDICQALKQAKSDEPDILYVNTITQPWYIAVGKLLGIPTLVHVREAESPRNWLILHGLYASLRFATIIVCNSKASAEIVKDTLSKRRWNRIRVIYNGKDWGEYLSSEYMPDAEPRFLVIGRVSPRKGQDVAIDALSILHSEGISGHLDFVGDTFQGYEWFQDVLEQQAKSLALEEYCHFHGYTRDVALFLDRCTVLTVPSRQEPFGTVALEGWAARRPVVVSDTQGLAEIVTHKEDGLIFESENPSSLADSWSWVLEHGHATRIMIQNATAHLDERFSIDQYRREILEAIDSCLRKHS